MTRLYLIFALSLLAEFSAYGALASHQFFIQKACAVCKKSGIQLLACARCKNEYYCSPDCQKAAWSDHKKVCKSFNTLDQQGERGNTQLIAAILDGDVEKCRDLINRGASVNAPNIHGFSPLLAAIRKNNLAICKLLLEKGAKVNQPANNGATALHLTAELGFLEICKLLLEHRTDIDPKLHDGATPLFMASSKGHLEICQLLLQHHANVNQSRKDSITPLYIAAERGHFKICQLLLQHHANVNYQTNTGSTALYIASQNGHFEICQLLLQHQADADQSLKDGTTPFFTAIQQHHFAIGKLLLGNGVNINQTRNTAATPLYMAAQDGDLEACQFLLEHSANVNQATKVGATPLYIAAHNRHLEVCRLLLHYHADIDQPIMAGTTPLHVAGYKGFDAICELLLQHNANISIAYKSLLPIQNAAWWEQLGCLEKLYKQHVFRKVPSDYNDTPLLIWLLQNNKYKSVLCLLKMGAFNDLLPEEQKQFFALAIQGWREDIIAFLYPDIDPAQFIVDHLCQHVFLVQESKPTLSTTQEKDYDDLPAPIEPVKPKSRFDEPLVALDTAGPADDITFTTVTKPTHDKTIIGTLSNRVSQWFVNPEQAWLDQGYCTPGHSKYTAPTEHDRVIIHHTFPRVIDLILTDAHCIFSDYTETGYRLYGTITHKQKTEHGSFTYTVGENGCYHRSFSNKQKMQKGAIFCKPDVQLIEKLKNHYSCKKLRIIPSKTGICIVDPTTHIIYTVYCIKN